ncbi:Transcription factor SOX-5 [Bienertia sinuspersici]
METLVVVAQHRNQYYSGRGKSNSSMRFGSSPTGGFRDVNCRAFESGIGLLPSPFKGYGTPVMNRGFVSPKPQTPCGKSVGKSKSEDVKPSKKSVRSSPIPINLKVEDKKTVKTPSRESLSFSELWAGPAYSNSPPPSSLPMPKFSLKPKRTVSLELPALESDVSLQPMAKSAPASPTRESARSSLSFLNDDDSATKTLRRILNLDVVDD